MQQLCGPSLLQDSPLFSLVWLTIPSNTRKAPVWCHGSAALADIQRQPAWLLSRNDADSCSTVEPLCHCQYWHEWVSVCAVRGSAPAYS